MLHPSAFLLLTIQGLHLRLKHYNIITNKNLGYCVVLAIYVTETLIGVFAVYITISLFNNHLNAALSMLMIAIYIVSVINYVVLIADDAYTSFMATLETHW